MPFLCRAIETRLKGELASSWEDAKIEYIFSVPTTWRPLPTVERFRKIIAAAGFAAHPKHTATIGLTEAEAAAVHTARSMPGIFKENEVLFVCDVGGGTTDLSVFRVKDTIGGSLSLEQLDVVFGATIGAAQLDTLFENAVLERLQDADQAIPTGLPDLDAAAWEMRISKEYQNAKCDYGSEESMADTDTFAVRVPKLDPGYTNEEYGISGGDMHFQRDHLKAFFDTQISKLFDMMDKQLVRLQQKHPTEQVAHLVLSGGLGNSPYVQSCLRSKYAVGKSPHSNAQSIQIRVAPDPQLVVCKGNVADRVQKLKSGRSVLGWRCCRASYGTKCKILYDANNPQHIGLRTETDPLDKKPYVVDCVDWFIKKVCVPSPTVITQLTDPGRSSIKRLPHRTRLQPQMPPLNLHSPRPPTHIPHGHNLLGSRCRPTPLRAELLYAPPIPPTLQPLTKPGSLPLNLQSRLRLRQHPPLQFQAKKPPLVEQRQKIPPHQLRRKSKSWARRPLLRTLVQRR
ncbi:hypothetical protein N0V95_000397 [Ascochyta clinopodiicola]|nr:hypothetical protein N0V95_000397 [Ascochyta clinopodiicola]